MSKQLDYGRFESCVGDTPEQIRMCLECKFEECINCLDTRHGERKRAAINFDKIKELKRSKGVLGKTDRAVLQAYLTSKTDKDIAKKIGKAESVVHTTRTRLGLPTLRWTTPEDRRKLVDIWMEDGIST